MITKTVRLLTVFVFLLTSGGLMAQFVGKPGGNTLNFINTNAFGGQLGHQQSGAFGNLGANDQWIGIGQPAIPTPVYGTRIQWDGSLATMVLQDGGVSKNLEIQWGGLGSAADMDFKFVFDPLNPAGERQIMRLTDQGRVGIGTTTPIGKLDVSTASTDNNFYGIYSQNDRTFGGGASLRGATYGSYNFGFQPAANVTTYGSYCYGSKDTPGSAFGVWGQGYSTVNGSGYGVYGVGLACGGSAYGVYGTTSFLVDCPTRTPAYAGYFDGNVVVTGTLTVLSDRRLKTNIENETSALEKIMQLRPTTYEFDHQKFEFMHMAKGLNHGFIAQELEEVFPEMVTENAHPIADEVELDDEGMGDFNTNGERVFEYKGVNYQMMIPVLTKAMQEQQVQIEAGNVRNNELAAELDAEKVRNDALAAELETIKQQIAGLSDVSGKGQVGAAGINDLESNVLYQNFPNPFDANTAIRYTTTKEAQVITLNIYDLQGREISQFDNLKAGEGSVNISGATLDAGMYIYTLIVDGKEVDSKRMILTKN